jgi:PIN domain nuclease of toxin-antitoxin system
LLDTCELLWLTTDASELSEKAKQVFQNPNNAIYLSGVSIWEMLVKHQVGKFPFATAAEAFIRRQCERHFIGLSAFR